MKKAFLLPLCTILIFGSCTKFNTKDSDYIIEDKFLMVEKFSVPIMENKVTIVTLGSDTLAITDQAIYIDVPEGISVTTKSDEENGITITYHNYSELPEFTPGSYMTSDTHIFIFEDSFDADYDYNDVVLHVKAGESGSTSDRNYYFSVKVRGIALGSTKKIGFGFTDMNGNDYDLTDDVRRDYFNNIEGFVNTVKGSQWVYPIAASNAGNKIEDERVENAKYPYSIIHTSKSHPEDLTYMASGYIEYDLILTQNNGIAHRENNNWKRLSYYIKVDGGKKLYVAMVDKTALNALPYGLRFMDNDKTDEANRIALRRYPIEWKFIGDAFPDFTTWIQTGSPFRWNAENYNPDLCYEIPSSGLWRF